MTTAPRRKKLLVSGEITKGSSTRSTGVFNPLATQSRTKYIVGESEGHRVVPKRLRTTVSNPEVAALQEGERQVVPAKRTAFSGWKTDPSDADIERIQKIRTLFSYDHS